MSASVQTSWKEKISNNVDIPILTKCCFCFPLRKGLITFAYLNFVLGLVVVTSISIDLSRPNGDQIHGAGYPRLIVDITAMVLELAMTIVFIVALHLKHVLMMKIYLYFEIVFSIVGCIYSLAFIGRETAEELFLILFQLMIQMYLVILIWSSVVKMKRNVSVNYVQHNDTV